MADEDMSVGSVSTYEYNQLISSRPNNSSVILIALEHDWTFDGYRAALFAAYFCLFMIGLVGNLWVIYVVSMVIRQPRTEAPRPFQIFILALCMCDLWVLSFLVILLADLVNGEWAFQSIFLCRIYLCSESLNKFCAPFLLAALSGFCYWNLKGETDLDGENGMERRRSSVTSIVMMRKWPSAGIVVGVCLGLGLVSMTPLYAYSDLFHMILHNDSHVIVLNTKCAFHPPEQVMTAFMVYSFIGGYAIPAASFTFFYCAILARVHRQHATSTVRYGHYTVPYYFWRLVRTTLGLVVFYLVCWSPFYAMSVYQYFQPSDQEESSLVMVGYFVHMLPYINSTGHPIMYTLLNKALKNDFERVKARLMLAKRRKSELVSVGSGSSRRMTVASIRSQRSGSGTSSVIALLNTKRVPEEETRKQSWLIWRNPHIALGNDSYGTFQVPQGITTVVTEDYCSSSTPDKGSTDHV